VLSVVRVGCCRAAAFSPAQMEKSNKVRSTCRRRQAAKATMREPRLLRKDGRIGIEKSVSNKKGGRVGCIAPIYGAWVTGLLGLQRFAISHFLL
jgi:hypothetical protein